MCPKVKGNLVMSVQRKMDSKKANFLYGVHSAATLHFLRKTTKQELRAQPSSSELDTMSNVFMNIVE